MENKQNFEEMLNNNKDMPKIIVLDDIKAIEHYGGKNMAICPPLDYDSLMKQVPYGKLVTVVDLRKQLAKKYDADFTCPLTAGIFVNIVAWAASERKEDITPYWRTLKANGELNPKYPGGILEQKRLLEEEGHQVISTGLKNTRYYVLDYITCKHEF